MNHIQSNKIKAALFLSVFSLNTIVGFACSLGLDMGYNSKHHDEKESTEAVVHIHADGKKHVHYEKKNTHQHNKPDHDDQSKANHKSREGKDNCCSDQVLKLEQTDKSLPNSLSIPHPAFAMAFVEVFYSLILPPDDLVKDIKQFVQGYHPPISDVRIAIRSFQI